MLKKSLIFIIWLNAICANDWIPWTDYLPKNKRVLFYDAEMQQIYLGNPMAYIRHAEFLNRHPDITHWMPLPEPP